MGHEVGPQDYDRARRRGDLMGLRVVVVVRLQLQGACRGPQEDHHHEPVAEELGEPLHDLLLVQRPGLLLLVRLASLMDERQGPVGDADAEMVKVGLDPDACEREGVVHLDQELPVSPRLILNVRRVQLSNVAGALAAQQGFLDDAVDLHPAVIGIEILDLGQHRLQGALLELRRNDAKALSCQLVDDFQAYGLCGDRGEADISRGLSPAAGPGRGHGC
mmetsp:Transcript_104418/g.295088  ORF Transcript_104418/g.295088 Transcript_104418/m.295088 type:complete len:219 (-) Transcript_104418:72-728(-)